MATTEAPVIPPHAPAAPPGTRRGGGMRAANLAIAAGAILISMAILVGARQYPFWARTAPGTGLMPVLLGVAGLILGLTLLINTLRKPPSDPLDLPDRAMLLRIVWAMVGLVLVMLLTPVVGLLLALIAFMLFMMLGLLRSPMLPSLLTTAITAGLVYGVFMRWLHVPIPTGPLGF